MAEFYTHGRRRCQDVNPRGQAASTAASTSAACHGSSLSDLGETSPIPQAVGHGHHRKGFAGRRIAHNLHQENVHQVCTPDQARETKEYELPSEGRCPRQRIQNDNDRNSFVARQAPRSIDSTNDDQVHHQRSPAFGEQWRSGNIIPAKDHKTIHKATTGTPTQRLPIRNDGTGVEHAPIQSTGKRSCGDRPRRVGRGPNGGFTDTPKVLALVAGDRWQPCGGRHCNRKTKSIVLGVLRLRFRRQFSSVQFSSVQLISSEQETKK